MIVKVDCGGTWGGAVKVVFAPAAVCVGEKEPQAEFPVFAQVTTQSTPALAESLVTTAETCVEVPVVISAGGLCIIATAMSGV